MRGIIVTMAVLALTLVWASAATAEGDAAQAYADAYQAGKPVAPASSQMKSLDLTGAYVLQKNYMANLVKAGHQPAGYKAGLTSPPAQKRFNAPGPLSGMLMNSMLIKDGVVDSKPYNKVMLEVEIGYVLNKDVTAPVTPDSVKGLVGQIMPAVEVPDLNFTSMKGLTFPDIAAANIGARGYILGKALPPAKIDVNAVTGQLFMGDKPLGKPIPGRAAMGDQYKALAWLINNALAQGMEVKAGMHMITGSLGPMYPGKPGAYRAVYSGGLGEITFTIK
jgi:2-keto-4-pentenoate hydratase